MAQEMRLPDIGEGLTEAEIVSWAVDVGEPVTANEPIVEVETAKAVVEITALRSGVLLHRGGAAGDVIDVGAVLAVIGDPGEVWSNGAEEVGPIPGPPATAPGAAGTEAPAAPSPGAVRAVPLVRKLARTLGVDLSTVTGTGPDGQITRGDVESAASRPPAVGASAAAPAAGEQRLSPTRRAIAANMARSWAEIPHVTVWGPADATALLAARKAAGGGPLEAWLIGAVLPVLQAHPVFNAGFDGETLRPSAEAHIGIAVDTAAGLLVPVVRRAGGRTHDGLVAEVERLTAAAAERKLTPDDMAGATFTISNVGAVGGGYGTPIIPHGTTAILSVGRAADDVVVRDKAIRIAPVFPVSLSFDHRVIDGALASRFLNQVVAAVESFET